ncbi:hypothetical protein E6H20_03490 [Candidatus Bathyarchaeota archaeon]|nr:MAG: hypothetical protein E6H20_03490 [Candidatus Bathyarchaeota archaeon]
MCAKSIERLLRLPFYCDEAYNVSLEVGLFRSILRRRLRPAQRKSTTIATTATPPFSFEIIDVFSIQHVKVPQKEGSPGPLTWKRIQILFETHPERLQVAEFLLNNGFSIKDNRIYVNEVEVPALKVARAIEVDLPTVAETIRVMELNREIRTVFRS